MPVESDMGRQPWERRLVAIAHELTSEPVEGLADVVRLTERMLAAAGVDVEARPDVRTNDGEARIARGTSSRALSEPRTILQVQGAYYVVTGLWAVVHRRGFEAVSGRKTDYWLVRTVGLLAGTIGLSLLVGTREGRPSPETTMLGVAAGAAFTAVDLVYVAKRRISLVYLGDAAFHTLLAGLALLGSTDE